MSSFEKFKGYNLYHLVGVESFSGSETVKKGFRKIALQYHPDRSPNDDQAGGQFLLRTEAYGILRDEGSRAAYDRELRNEIQPVRFKKERLIRQRQKSPQNRYYSKTRMVDWDYNLFVDECRENFALFLKNADRIKAPSKIHSAKTMGKTDFEGLVAKGRKGFRDYLSSLPRVKS